MNPPLVTILVPTYNRARLLRDAVRSAMAQTHARLEILILDDASPDETPTVAAALAAKDARIRHVRRPTNLGIAGNWRAGFAEARGEYLCILHDDDTFEPAFVATLLARLQRDPQATFAFCDQWVMSADGTRDVAASEQMSRRFRRDRLPAGAVADLPRVALVDRALPVGATLFRRSALVPSMIDDAAKGAIDYWLVYQLVRAGAVAHYVPQRLMNYRTHAGSMSGGMPAYMAEGHLHRLNAAIADERLVAIREELLRQRRDVRTAYGIALLRSGERWQARRILRTSLAEQIGARSAVAWMLAFGGPVGTRIARRLTRR